MPSAPNDPSTPLGSITDVAGVRVGHHQRTGRGWQSGTTVVHVPTGATPGVDVRGGGPGTRETDAIDPQNLVQQIHAVCLTGGSAFGLAAADGVVEWLEARGQGFPIGPVDEPYGVVPVVPAAVVFDLGRAGAFANRPDRSFGMRAAANARSAQRRWGAVGAGTGSKAGGLQGGVGTASTVVDVGTHDAPLPVSVGAIAVVNSNGSVIDPRTGLPWDDHGIGLRRPSAEDRRRVVAALDGQGTNVTARLNTTIGVVATSADLSKAEVSKLASVAHDGMARAVRPAHSMFDGDTVFALATGEVPIGEQPPAMRSTPSRQSRVNQVLAAAADVFAAACVHAVVTAETVGTAPAYRDLCPTSFRT